MKSQEALTTASMFRESRSVSAPDAILDVLSKDFCTIPGHAEEGT